MPNWKSCQKLNKKKYSHSFHINNFVKNTYFERSAWSTLNYRFYIIIPVLCRSPFTIVVIWFLRLALDLSTFSYAPCVLTFDVQALTLLFDLDFFVLWFYSLRLMTSMTSLFSDRHRDLNMFLRNIQIKHIEKTHQNHFI